MKDRYTITEHHNTFDNVHKWYSLHDNVKNVDVELDNRTWDYAVEVCSKFNKEARAGLHDDGFVLVNGCYVYIAE